MNEVSKLRNGLGKAFAGVVALGTLGSGVLFVDARYLHADTYATDHQQTVQEIRNVERSRIEDELFKLKLVQPAKRTSVENAVIERYEHRIQELNSLNRQVDKK